MKPNAEETAVLVASLLQRSQERRARISERTIRLLSRRRTLRDAFKDRLRDELDDLGIHLVQLERGGFGVIPITALDGARAITAKRYMPDELKKLKKAPDESFFIRLRDEITEEIDEGDDSDE